MAGGRHALALQPLRQHGVATVQVHAANLQLLRQVMEIVQRKPGADVMREGRKVFPQLLFGKTGLADVEIVRLPAAQPGRDALLLAENALFRCDAYPFHFYPPQVARMMVTLSPSHSSRLS